MIRCALLLGLFAGLAQARHRHHRVRARTPLVDSLPSSFFAPDSVHEGVASFYRFRGCGACALPSRDTLLAAVSNAHFAGADLCGACVDVRGPGGRVVARVVDRCPSCAEGGLDLSRQAFRRIAPLGAGRVAVAWRLADCPFDTSMEIHRARGRSRTKVSLQVRWHGVPLRTLETRSDTGWIVARRSRANRFLATVPSEGPWMVRLTDAWARQVVDSQVEIAPGASARLRCRFPSMDSLRGSADDGTGGGQGRTGTPEGETPRQHR